MEEIIMLLLERGMEFFNNERRFVEYAHQNEADELLNNIEEYPQAFLIACICDRQYPAEKVWEIPYRLKERLGDFSFENLSAKSKEEFILLMQNPTSLHRFNNKFGEIIYLAIQKVITDYNNNTSKIWNDNPSSATLVYRFLTFKGVGIKIATMSANILVRDFKIQVTDKYSIDISPDVQVKRVFARLGLVNNLPSSEEIIYKARSMNPEYPGVFDLSCWEIGRNWCRPRNTLCEQCYLNNSCPKVGIN
jgi:endonuclease III